MLAPSPPQPVARTPLSVPTKTIKLPHSGSALGVDWSGSKQAGKKICVARIAFGPRRARLIHLERAFRGRRASSVAGCFAAWLTGQEFDVAGLDFCFGLSSEHMAPGLPTGGPAALGPWLSRFPRPEDFKAALGHGPLPTTGLWGAHHETSAASCARPTWRKIVLEPLVLNACRRQNTTTSRLASWRCTPPPRRSRHASTALLFTFCARADSPWSV
jgi:hypothetical protein